MCGVFDEYRQSIPEMMAKHKIPGLSIAVVDRDSILWTAGFGYTDYDRKTPVTPETIFAIMSITKAITATTVMCAVQDGLVELDAPISKYLANFTVNSRFENNPQDKITLRHLLTHTAGFPHEAPIGNMTDTRFDSFEEHVKSISGTWLKYRIGEKYSYSNIGFDLAAYIVQVQAGKSFAEYVKEKLFSPLGMPNSSADMEFIGHYPNRAIGHLPHVKEVPLEIPTIGAGGVYSNAKDFARFIQFYLNWGKVNGRIILDESLIRTMYTPSPLSTLHKRTGLGIGCMNCDGYMVDDDGNYLCGGFWGGGFGFNTFTAWSHDYEIGCLVFTNSRFHNQNETIALNIIHRLINENHVVKGESFDDQPWKRVIDGDNDEDSFCQPSGPKTFTPYQPAWKKYIGTYRHIMSGCKLDLYAKLAVALGNWGHGDVKVYEENGFLEIDGQRLDGHLPGLFFTDEGDCLDFRGPTPTWRNLAIKKIK